MGSPAICEGATDSDSHPITVTVFPWRGVSAAAGSVLDVGGTRSWQRERVRTVRYPVGLHWSRREFVGGSLAIPPLSGARESGAVYAERRRRLASDVGGGVIALVGHDGTTGESGFTGFRQESNFYYLTGHEEPGAALLIASASQQDSYREVLFLPGDVAFGVPWHEPPSTAAKVRSLTFGDARSKDRFVPELRSMLRGRGKLFALRARTRGDVGSRLRQRVEGIVGGRDIRDLDPLLARMRSIKSPGEIALIEQAARATVLAHRAAWSVVQSGVPEHALVAEFVGAAFRAGCRRLAFPPMAGSGRNATTLHYQRNDAVMQAGQLVLMDAGGEYFRYAADVARTVPVDGCFRADQRCLYELVLGAQAAAIRMAGPGATLGGSGPMSLLARAERYMRDRAPKGLDVNLPHAVGHHIGLDVHDPYPFRSPLQAGMVVTVEPGIYLPDRRIGIRIEDMIVITDDGCRQLSGELPVLPDAIEKALAAG